VDPGLGVYQHWGAMAGLVLGFLLLCVVISWMATKIRLRLRREPVVIQQNSGAETERNEAVNPGNLTSEDAATSASAALEQRTSKNP